MEIILLQDIHSLGHKDQIIRVKDGFANNYLIPKGFAIVASTSAKKVVAENIRQRAHKEDRIKDEAQELAKQLENKKLTIGAKTSSTGKIFGSVNSIQISEALQKKGFNIDRKMIHVDEEHIKEVGAHKAVIKLHREVSVEIEFDVVAE